MLEQRITDLARPVIEDLGYRLINVQIYGGEDYPSLQIMAENPETRNLGVDECAKISKALSPVLDVEDIMSGRYRLEISSPGIDRMLVTAEDFSQYEGFEIKAELKQPNADGQKRFRGVVHFDDSTPEKITIENAEHGTAELEIAALAKAKLVLTDELLKKEA